MTHISPSQSLVTTTKLPERFLAPQFLLKPSKYLPKSYEKPLEAIHSHFLASAYNSPLYRQLEKKEILDIAKGGLLAKCLSKRRTAKGKLI